MGFDRRIALVIALVIALFAGGGARAQDPAPPPETPHPAIDLQGRLKDVTVQRTPQGDRLRLRTESGTVELSPQQFSDALYDTQHDLEEASFLYRVFNITRPMSFVWIGIGFLGQALFTFRMVLQWFASEKEKRSVIPVGFWWGSLLGGILLFAYFAWRKDVVGIVGQSTGIFVYMRNLVLIYGRAAAEPAPSETAN